MWGGQGLTHQKGPSVQCSQHGVPLYQKARGTTVFAKVGGSFDSFHTAQWDSWHWGHRVSRTQLAHLDSKAESEGIEYKLGPNKSALSGRNLERERAGAMSLSFPQISPTKPLPVHSLISVRPCPASSKGLRSRLVSWIPCGAVRKLGSSSI